MSRNQRLGMLAVAALIIAVALIVLPGSGEDDDPQPAAQTAAEPVTTTAVTTATEVRTSATTQTTPKPKPKPKPPLLTAAKPRELEYKKGDTISFRVRHSTDEEIHVHGYDKSKDIQAGKTATMSFKANIEGIFEVELEHSGAPLGTLKVEPN